MTNQIPINTDDLQDLIIYAGRYTMGRMTSAPHTFQDICLKHLRDLKKDTIKVIIADIEREEKLDRLGADFDKKMWLDLLHTLKSEIQKSDETIKVLNYLQEFAENNLNNGWISVDDELPKPFEKVLVYVKTPKKVIIDTDSHNPELLQYGVKHSFVATKYEVTHWQPLPKPPKE